MIQIRYFNNFKFIFLFFLFYLMQIITDIMSRRPRLNLQANYFTDSYAAEFECLENQLELVKFMIKT